MFTWIKQYRVSILTGLSLVALAAEIALVAKTSWGHIAHDAAMVGEPDAFWIPVSVDGMMLAGGFMGAVDRLRGYKARPWSIVSLVLGTAASLAGNAWSAWERGLGAVIVAAWPAVALFVTVEIMFHPSRRLLAVVKDVVTAIEASVSPPAPVQAAAPEPVVLAPMTVTSVSTLPDGMEAAPIISMVPIGPERPPRVRVRKANPTAVKGEGARPTRAGKPRALMSIK